MFFFFFFQAEDGIRDFHVTGVQTCALPILTNEEWLSVPCPRCGRNGRRESETMDTFVDSSWYFMRYCDPHNGEAPFERRLVDYWMPVNQYIGGAEHATMHLLYARFFVKVLNDLGLLGFREPFMRLFMGPVDQDKEWQDTGIEGVVRFLNRLWRLVHEAAAADDGAAAGDGPLV